MMRNFIKLLLAVVVMFASTARVMAEAEDVVVTTSGREVNLCAGDGQQLKVYAVDTLGEITDFRYQWYYSSSSAILPNQSGWTEMDGDTTDVFYKAAPEATYESSNVEWNLSSLNTLLDGVKYEVTNKYQNNTSFIKNK